MTQDTNSSARTVLVIDDSPDVHRLLQARLRNEQLALDSATSGTSGFERAKTIEPDLVLLDVDMPDLDGFEVLRRLKDERNTADIPVVMLSGHTSPQDKVTAFDLGAVDYVVKPFDLTELRARIRSALRISSLLKMLAQRAHIDGLTGCWNRAHFDSIWPTAIAEAARHERPLSVLILDADHFKSVNDMYGHPAGDAVLEKLAELLRAECRSEDVPCRYGGEEFVVVLPETDPEAAGQFAERVRARIADVVWPKHPERSVTVSIGVAGTDGAATLAPEQWLEVADKQLYAAKQGGRNRVMTARVGPQFQPVAKAG
ncbi:MAG: diguanylate cyclase [Planctomycetota bacterium]